MRKIVIVALVLGFIAAAVPALAEQSVNPVPGDLWLGASIPPAAFAPAGKAPVATLEQIRKDPSRFKLELQTEPAALLPGAISN